jgi:hypothetical protein
MKVEILGTMALAVSKSVDALHSKRDTAYAWIGNNVEIINESPLMTSNYSVSPSTELKYPKLKLNTSEFVSFFPQGENEIHAVPNIDNVQEITQDFTNKTSVQKDIYPSNSYFRVMVAVNPENDRIENATVFLHPNLEAPAIKKGSKEERVEIFGKTINSIIGFNIDNNHNNKIENIYDALSNCGNHANGDGSGDGYTRSIEYGREIFVTQAGTTYDNTMPEEISGDCGATIRKWTQSNQPGAAPSITPDVPKDSSASSLRILSNKELAAGAVIVALPFI